MSFGVCCAARGGASAWGQGAFGGMGGGGLPGMPGPHPGYRPTGGYSPVSMSEGGIDVGMMPDSGMNLYSGWAGSPTAGSNPFSYGSAQSVLPGYEMGESGYGPYTPPGTYGRAEADYGGYGQLAAATGYGGKSSTVY